MSVSRKIEKNQQVVFKMVKIDSNKCIGCGLCTSICEEVFEFDFDKGKAKVKDPKSKSSCVKEAIDVCPVDAIS